VSEAPADARPTPNRWWRALWIVGAALVVLGVAFSAFADVYLADQTNDTSANSAARTQFELALLLAPSVITAGLVSIVLAIAVRALGGLVLQRAVENPEPAAAPTVLPEIAQPLPRPAAAAPVLPTDNSLYMRPPVDGATTHQ
jgi:hypothetical protein